MPRLYRLQSPQRLQPNRRRSFHGYRYLALSPTPAALGGSFSVGRHHHHGPVVTLDERPFACSARTATSSWNCAWLAGNCPNARSPGPTLSIRCSETSKLNVCYLGPETGDWIAAGGCREKIHKLARFCQSARTPFTGRCTVFSFD